MAQCTAYRHQVDKKSPFFPLLEAIRAKGITDDKMDRGVRQIDYAKPGQWGQTEGARDCFIDVREVLGYALLQWRDYREPLRKVLGNPLPWDFDPSEKDATPEQQKRQHAWQRKLSNAIAAAKGDLAAAGLAPNSDAFRSALGEALYLWLEFPTDDDWKRYGPAQRAAILQRFSRIDALKLTGFKKKLLEAGGSGKLFVRSCGVDLGSQPFGLQIYSCPHNAGLLLYYIFERAGLNPHFVELSGLSHSQFTCGKPFMLRQGVGVPLASGWRVFDPIEHNPDAQRTEVFYPMTRRQALAARMEMPRLFDAIFSRTAPASAGIGAIQGDGLAPIYSHLTEIIVKASQGKASDASTPAHPLASLEAHFRSGKKAFHPLLGALFLASRSQSDKPGTTAAVKALHQQLSAHPAMPRRGLRDLLTVYAASFTGDEKPFQPGLGTAMKSLLEMDPGCFEAHFYKAYQGTTSKQKGDAKQIEEHFAKAASALPSRHPARAQVHYWWGEFDLDRGQTASAREKFSASFSAATGQAHWRARSGIFLAMLMAAEGNAGKAAEVLTQATRLAIQELRELDRDTVEGWYEWLKERRQKKKIVPESAFKDARFAAATATLYESVAQSLLYHGMLEEARITQEAAIARAPEEAKGPFMVVLHEIRVRQGKLGEAEKIWTEIMRRATTR